MEMLICAEHKEAIDAGADWSPDYVDNTIRMGGDLPRRVDSWSLEGPDLNGYLEFDLRHEEGPDTPVRIHIEQARELASWINDYLPEDQKLGDQPPSQIGPAHDYGEG